MKKINIGCRRNLYQYFIGNKIYSIKARKGNMLVEVLVSIVILGIFLTIAYPKPNGDIVNLKKSSEILMSDIRESSYIAQHKRSPNYRISISYSDNCYRIYDGVKLVKKVNMQKGIYIFSNVGTIKFSAVRSGNISNPCTIYLYAKKIKRVERITISVGSTRVRSYSESYEENKEAVDARGIND